MLPPIFPSRPPAIDAPVIAEAGREAQDGAGVLTAGATDAQPPPRPARCQRPGLLPTAVYTTRSLTPATGTLIPQPRTGSAWVDDARLHRLALVAALAGLALR